MSRKLEDYKKKVEGKNYRHNLHLLSNIIEKLRNRFEEGDILNIAYYDNWTRSVKDKYSLENYHIRNKQTEIPHKYKVAYVDSKGFAHIHMMNVDGKFSDIYPIQNHINDIMTDISRNRGSNYSDLDLDRLFMLDSEYADSAILGEEYDPMFRIKQIEKEFEAKDKENAELWYKLHEYNKGLRMHTRTVRNRTPFKRRLEVGDKIWDSKIGYITLAIKDFDGDIFVFKDENGSLCSYNSMDIKKSTFYRDKPKKLPEVPFEIRQKYKPNRTKTDSK